MKRSNPLLFTSLCCVALLCGALVVWTAFSGWESEAGEHRGKNTEGSSANALHSQNRTEFKRQHLSRKPAPKRIDVKARLTALYEKYPDLKPDYPESDKDYSELFEKWFSEEAREQLDEELATIEGMLSGEKPWDSRAIESFLKENQERLQAVIDAADSEHHYDEIKFSGARTVLRLLTVSYGLNLKSGDELGAKKIREAFRAMSNSSAKYDMMGWTLIAASQRSMNEYALNASSIDNAQKVEVLLSAGTIEDSFFAAVKGDYTSVLKLGYCFAELNKNGEFVVDEKAVGKDISLEAFEEVGAEVVLANLKFYDELQESGKYLPREELEKMWKEHVRELGYQGDEKVIAETFVMGGGFYLSAAKKFDLHQQSQLVALRIAKATYAGAVYAEELPVNFHTGEPIIWDKERNVLITGLEGDDAEIKIPTLKSE